MIEVKKVITIKDKKLGTIIEPDPKVFDPEKYRIVEVRKDGYIITKIDQPSTEDRLQKLEQKINLIVSTLKATGVKIEEK
ncbi:hypothetical protein J7L13_03275 [bacterium]|nr:hypothetical protein [bacterium]